jgi:oligosaccharide repeat unit polymerase
MIISKLNFFKNIHNNIILWFPALPFLAYWLAAYFQFNFGKYVTPSISLETHFFVISYFLIFTFFYKIGIRYRREPKFNYAGTDDKIALKILKISSWLLFIGTLLYVYDRLSSGAGSFDIVQNELSSVRGGMSDETTLITTIAVIPQSFKLVAIASYFFSIERNLRIPKYVHIILISTVMLEIVNMILSANRGALFWIISYVFFYLIYIKRRNILSDIFSNKYLIAKILLICTIFAAYTYFVWVAENRVVAATADYLGRQAYFLLKDPDNITEINYSRFGGEYQIFYYLTHGFNYTDAILKHAPIINFDFLSPLGIRIEFQLQRFNSEYQFPAKIDLFKWMTASGLSTSGWASIFGASLAYFGIIGSLIFSAIVGYFSGYSSRRWLKTRSLGWLIIVLLVFSSLNMSFDWILKDFDQFMAIIIGVTLILKRKKFYNQTHICSRNNIANAKIL